MTRINVVPVEELSRQHLVAEYRELPRVFTLIRKAVERGEEPDDPRNPREYTLGKGHVRFFYDKAAWLTRRFYQLYYEMLRRGYKPTYDYAPNYDIPLRWFKGFETTPQALEINRERIKDRGG